MLTEVVLLPSSFSSSILLHPLYFYPLLISLSLHIPAPSSSPPSPLKPFWVEATTQHHPPPTCSLLSISSSSFSHFLCVCQLVSPDPMSGPSWSLLHFRIYDLAHGEAKDTEINQSDFSDTSWTDWAYGHKMVRAQCPFPAPQHAERVPTECTVDQSPVLSKLGMAQQWWWSQRQY